MTTGTFAREKGKGSLDWPPAIQTGEQQLEVFGNSKGCYCWLALNPRENTLLIWITIRGSSDLAVTSNCFTPSSRFFWELLSVACRSLFHSPEDTVMSYCVTWKKCQRSLHIVMGSKDDIIGELG